MQQKSFREIESPLSAFNNFQIDISDKLNHIIYGNTKLNQLTLKSELIFNADSIIIMGFCKLFDDRNVMKMQMLKPLDKEQLEIVAALESNFQTVETCYYQYIQLYNRIAKGYNDVPNKLLVDIINMIEQPKYAVILESTSFLIPFKTKMGARVEKNLMVFMDKFYSRFEYVIKFKQDSKTLFSYFIYKVLSSDLNENKSLENIRFLEYDLMKSGSVKIEDAENFIKNLFCYGNF